MILLLTLHFLLSLRAAFSAYAQQTTSSSFTFPRDAQDTTRRLLLSSSTPVATASPSLPPALEAADGTITTTTADRAAVQTWPIHSLFLPVVDPGNLAASIISVVRYTLIYAPKQVG